MTASLRAWTLAVVLSPVLVAQAVPPVPVRLAVGAEVPEFARADAQGRRHRLSDYAGSVLVLEWTSHVCPAVQGWLRDGSLAKVHAAVPEGVVWLAVDSSFYAEHCRAAIARFRQAHALDAACLLDPDGTLGRSLGVTTTPQVVVIDAAGRLAYRGAIAERTRAGVGRVLVHDAIAAVLAGQPVQPAETRANGCGVKYWEDTAPRTPAREATVLFQWAGDYASEDMASAALDLFAAAAAAGYPRPSEVHTDPRFARLRSDAATRAKLRDALRAHARESDVTMVAADEPGDPLHVRGVVRDADGKPVAGALLHVFQTDHTGHYVPGGLDESNPRLFAWLRTDAEGAFGYRTIRPAPYGGVAGSSNQHVHVEVFVADKPVGMDRLGFADDPHWTKRGEAPPRWVRSVVRGASGIAEVRQEITLRR